MIFVFLGFGGALDQAAVLDFVDSGRDLILAADPSASELIKGIAAECGADFDEVSIDFGDCYLFLLIFD